MTITAIVRKRIRKGTRKSRFKVCGLADSHHTGRSEGGGPKQTKTKTKTKETETKTETTDYRTRGIHRIACTYKISKNK